MQLQVSRVFTSCKELSALIGRCGYVVDAFQITSGPLFGRFEVVQVGPVLHLSIFTTQGILLYGQSNPAFMNCCIEEGNVDPGTTHCHLVQLPDRHRISGFNSEKTEVFFATSPGSFIRHMCIPKALMLRMIEDLYGIRPLFTLASSHSLPIPPKLHSQLLLSMRNARESNDEVAQMVLITDLVSALCDPKQVHVANPEAAPLVKDFVRMATEHGGPKPVSVVDLAAQLHTSKTTLSEHLKRLTGMSPSACLKMALLEQARTALRDVTDHRTVNQIGKAYGLGDRFSAKYKKHFGESPSQTLKIA